MALGKTILILGGVALAVMIAASHDDVTAPTPEQQQATAARVRALGYPCAAVLSLERVQVIGVAGAAAPRKIYRLSCGADGPDYRVTVEPDQRQTLAPWPSSS